MGGAGAILAAAADPRVAAVVSVSAPADPRRMVRQTFRLARLPFPGPIAAPLAWLTSRVFVRPRGHALARDQRPPRRRPLSRARSSSPTAATTRSCPSSTPTGSPAPRSPRGRASRDPAPVELLVVETGGHSWSYEDEAYRRTVAAFLARELGGPLTPRGGGRCRGEAVEARRLPGARGGARRRPGASPGLAMVGRSTRPASRDRLGRRPHEAGHPPVRRPPARARELDRILQAGRRVGQLEEPPALGLHRRPRPRPLGRLAAVGPWAGHLAGAAVAIALVTPDPARGRLAAVGAVRPRPGRREHDAGRLGARHRQRPGDRLRPRPRPARSSATPRTATASTCSRSAIRPTPASSTAPLRPGGRRPLATWSTRSAGRSASEPSLPLEPARGEPEADHRPADEDRDADAQRRIGRPADHHLAERVGQVGQGRNRATVWSAAGMIAIGKNVPDRNIIGNWTALVIPFAASSVFASVAMT